MAKQDSRSFVVSMNPALVITREDGSVITLDQEEIVGVLLALVQEELLFVYQGEKLPYLSGLDLRLARDEEGRLVLVPEDHTRN